MILIKYLISTLIGSSFFFYGHARDLYVQQSVANELTYLTFQEAIKASISGDTIHLPGGVLRESGVISGKENLTIDGHGSILDGAEPLPKESWQKVDSKIHKIKIKKPYQARHLVVFKHKIQKMKKTPSKPEGFPAMTELEDGEFCVEPMDKDFEWLYYRGDISNIELGTRVNGLAISGTNKNITIKNLSARHVLNDGFNIHGHGVGLLFQNIEGYNCFDEGFSAHDTSEAIIEDSKFHGGDNAVADVNDSVTTYIRCHFSRGVQFDVFLRGKSHQFIDCTISNETDAIALSALPAKDDDAFYISCSRLKVLTSPSNSKKARVQLGGEITLDSCSFTNVIMSQNTTSKK